MRTLLTIDVVLDLLGRDLPFCSTGGDVVVAAAAGRDGGAGAICGAEPGGDSIGGGGMVGMTANELNVGGTAR
ncbi:hypothetical protein [Sorangium sp. So ce394]|uniref:hypothetical protein n=1 Tax=Sorangium sp. So ce394 TaxID=3133310 RepID=UPI003F5C37D7